MPISAILLEFRNDMIFIVFYLQVLNLQNCKSINL